VFTLFLNASGLGTVTILGPSSAGCAGINGGTVAFYNDQSLGTDTTFSTRTVTYIPCGGARTLSQNITANGGNVTIAGTNDLTFTGQLNSGGNQYTWYMNGSGTLILNGNQTNVPAWVVNTTINNGTIRMGATNALGSGCLSFNGGVLELGAADYTNALGNGSRQVQWLVSTNGGFSAYGVGRVVNLGGNATPSQLKWGSTTKFISTGATLMFGSPQANAQVDFQNPLDLNGAVQTIQVTDNPAITNDQAMLSGILTNGGLTKIGAGTLVLGAANVYTNVTTISNGTLAVNGSLRSAITVCSNAVLTGTGRIGTNANATALTVQAGGIVDPGPRAGSAR